MRGAAFVVSVFVFVGGAHLSMAVPVLPRSEADYVPPRKCLYLSNTRFTQTNLSLADDTCLEQAGPERMCAGAWALLGRPGAGLDAQYTCALFPEIVACDSRLSATIGLVRSLAEPLVAPMQAALAVRNVSVWTNAAQNGTFTPCGATRLDGYFMLANSGEACAPTQTRPVLCVCDHPFVGENNDYIVGTAADATKVGDILAEPGALTIRISDYYVLNTNDVVWLEVGTNLISPQASVERVNAQAAFDTVPFLQLRPAGGPSAFEIEYQESGNFRFNGTHAFAPATGIWEMMALLETAPAFFCLHGSGCPCATNTRAFHCMRTLEIDTPIRASVPNAHVLGSTDRVWLRYLASASDPGSG